MSKIKEWVYPIVFYICSMIIALWCTCYAVYPMYFIIIASAQTEYGKSGTCYNNSKIPLCGYRKI